jgi:hypothetical protein
MEHVDGLDDSDNNDEVVTFVTGEICNKQLLSQVSLYYKVYFETPSTTNMEQYPVPVKDNDAFHYMMFYINNIYNTEDIFNFNINLFIRHIADIVSPVLVLRMLYVAEYLLIESFIHPCCLFVASLAFYPSEHKERVLGMLNIITQPSMNEITHHITLLESYETLRDNIHTSYQMDDNDQVFFTIISTLVTSLGWDQHIVDKEWPGTKNTWYTQLERGILLGNLLLGTEVTKTVMEQTVVTGVSPQAVHMTKLLGILNTIFINRGEYFVRNFILSEGFPIQYVTDSFNRV